MRWIGQRRKIGWTAKRKERVAASVPGSKIEKKKRKIEMILGWTKRRNWRKARRRIAS
jgi:hypothetical protein